MNVFFFLLILSFIWARYEISHPHTRFKSSNMTKEFFKTGQSNSWQVLDTSFKNIDKGKIPCSAEIS